MIIPNKDNTTEPNGNILHFMSKYVLLKYE